MRTFLIGLLFFTGITALFIGISMMSVPDGSLLKIPLSLLVRTSFTDYQIPGLMLVISVALPNMVALIFYLINHPSRFSWALASGILTLSWIIAQYSMINSFYLLDLFYFIIGLMVVMMAVQLRGKQLI
jgi:hypothetical protein